jgi:hypothetical protein
MAFPKAFGRSHGSWRLALCAGALVLPLAAGAQQTDQGAVKTAGGNGGVDVAGVVVNGVPYQETVLPTRLKTNSTYGLNLSVMDTPRNTTLLSTTQLQTLNIDDPRAFSYLTSSSYTDSAFGTPNIPRIRGQYADVFYNGMRASFSDNGYGAPLNFDSIANIAITKGPASVIDGPGPGVGGEVDLLTKRPSLDEVQTTIRATFDTINNRRWMVDSGGPIIPGVLGVMFSYSGEDSGSYFYGHYFHKTAVYGALRWRPNANYQLDINAEVNREDYTENVGINRVNQDLIDHGTYLQGGPDGNECFSSFSLPCNSDFFPIGSPGNPYSPVVPILTETYFTTPVHLDPKVTIDETPGTNARALMANFQAIQTFYLGGDLTIENNTFFNYLDSDNQDFYYFADNSKGSWTIEDKLDLTGSFTFHLGSWGISNQFVNGVDFRFQHVNYITNFSNEAVSVYDLTANPALWNFATAYQILGDALPYTSAFGRTQYGVPSRDPTNGENTGISDLWDAAYFFQDRMELSRAFSFLFGARIDAVQDRTRDPLPCFADNFCNDSLPAQHTTGVYGLADVNGSLTFRPEPWISTYVTFDWTQSLNPNGGVGGVNALTQVPDSTLLRANSYLYEIGAKLNLLNNKLFIGMAGFDQKHGVPTGQAGQHTDQANIRGFEIEANYQPNRNLYATASYSYIKTTLNSVPSFYDWPAQPGINIDGGALIFDIFNHGQKVDQPGQPQHVFNFLGNYKFENGLGFRFGAQVTGPINTTPSAWLDLPAMEAAYGKANIDAVLPEQVLASGGYYKSPVIPWQFTLNAAVYYEFKGYRLTLSCYNFTNQRNWQPSPSIYGNDFLVQNDPRSFEVRLDAKF